MSFKELKELKVGDVIVVQWKDEDYEMDGILHNKKVTVDSIGDNHIITKDGQKVYGRYSTGQQTFFKVSI